VSAQAWWLARAAVAATWLPVVRSPLPVHAVPALTYSLDFKQRLLLGWVVEAFQDKERIPAEDFLARSWRASVRAGVPLARHNMVEAISDLEELGLIATDTENHWVNLDRHAAAIALHGP